MRRERVDLRVLPAEKEKWMRFSAEHGLKMSEMIRRAVNNVIRMQTETKK